MPRHAADRAVTEGEIDGTATVQGVSCLPDLSRVEAGTIRFPLKMSLWVRQSLVMDAGHLRPFERVLPDSWGRSRLVIVIGDDEAPGSLGDPWRIG